MKKRERLSKTTFRASVSEKEKMGSKTSKLINSGRRAYFAAANSEKMREDALVGVVVSGEDESERIVAGEAGGRSLHIPLNL